MTVTLRPLVFGLTSFLIFISGQVSYAETTVRVAQLSCTYIYHNIKADGVHDWDPDRADIEPGRTVSFGRSKRLSIRYQLESLSNVKGLYNIELRDRLTQQTYVWQNVVAGYGDQLPLFNDNNGTSLSCRPIILIESK